jgi:hypothetical protein
MKIDTPELQVDRSNEMRTIKLRVSQDTSVIPIIVKMMADQYKDPLKTLSVEYVQNAIDSHRAANVLDKPLHIHLPNKIDPYFSVRDFGVSMSSETIENVFSELFASTKRTTDEMIGGFGVGRLVFGAYTGTMTITTFLNGKKTEYFFYLDQGKGDITEMMSEDSDEPNGVEIKIPIREGDFDRLRRICQQQYAFLTPPPIVTGNYDFTLGEVKYKFTNSDFCFKDTSGRWNADILENLDPVATVAQLPYPIDVYSCNLDEKYRKILRKGAVLHFNVGEVDIVPSRDNLKYTEKTREAIKVKIDKIVNLAQREVDKLCASENFDSEYSARTFWYKMFNHSTYENFLLNLLESKDISIKFGDKSISGFKIPIPNELDPVINRPIYKCELYTAKINDKGRLVKTGAGVFDCVPDYKYIWVDPAEKDRLISRKIKIYINENGWEDVGIIYPRGNYTLDDLEQECEFPRNMIVNILDIEIPKVKKVGNVNQKIIRRPRHVVKNAFKFYLSSGRSDLNWCSCGEIDLSEHEGFWCNRNYNVIRHMGEFSPSDIEFLLGHYNRHYNKSYGLYSIPDTKNTKVGPKMLHFKDEMEKFIPILKDKFIGDASLKGFSDLWEQINSEYSFLFQEYLKEDIGDLEIIKWVRKFENFITKLGITKDNDDEKYSLNRFKDVAVKFGIDISTGDEKPNPDYVKYNEMFIKFKKDVDLIQIIPSYRSEHRVKLLKLIDENLRLKNLIKN